MSALGVCIPAVCTDLLSAEMCTFAGYKSHCPGVLFSVKPATQLRIRFFILSLKVSKSTRGVLLVLLAFLIPTLIVYIFSYSISMLRSMPRQHTFMSVKLSANTAVFFQTVNCAVLLCNMCPECPKTGSLLPECSDVSLGCLLPSSVFPVPLSLLSSSDSPGLESGVCLALDLWDQQTADRTGPACSVQLEQGT